MPKQLQAIAHEDTMLQATALRVPDGLSRAGVEFLSPVIVSGEAHRFLVGEQLMQVQVEPSAVLLEPQGRNTAPAVALAAHHVAGIPGRLMLVMPSDHLIADVESFVLAIAAAAPLAAAGKLVTFGVEPTEPATGYGYIMPETSGSMPSAVARFVEKPDLETAQRYLEAGYLWNSGIFLFDPAAYLDALESHAPEVAEAVREAYEGRTRDGIFIRPDADEFARSPSISIDYAVMERSADVWVVPVQMGWSDVGSWDALWRVTVPDAEGNVVRGNGTLIQCSNSLVRNEDGPFVAALGLSDMVVVATGDAVLIAPRERSEDIRRVVDAVEARGLDLARSSHEVRRPWGSYRSICRGEGWQVKRIMVKPGGRLSLQKHARRAETWVVASGSAIVTIDNDTTTLAPGESAHIPLGAVHRLENPGPEPLELIEIQQGGYLGEDDIVRLQDVYGRAG